MMAEAESINLFESLTMHLHQLLCFSDFLQYGVLKRCIHGGQHGVAMAVATVY